MKRSWKIILVIVAIAFLYPETGCRKKEIEEIEEKKEVKISGQAQKGPFITGTNITITELDNNFHPTGKTYSTTISNNDGSFEFPNINLVSSYVILNANGYYYDEVNDEISKGKLSLSALVNISNSNTLNINVLTHLEKPRVEYLIEGGMTFSQAKQQAQQEILYIFEISNNSIPSSEDLNISQSGAGNAILLAISAILQGAHTSGELSELLSIISLDIKEDGVLDNKNAQSALINEATYLNLNKIRLNIEKRYNDLGINATVGNFETYITQFKQNTSFALTKEVSYPQNGKYGANILYLNSNNVAGCSSLHGIPPKGAHVKIVMKNTTSNPMQDMAVWWYSLGSNINLQVSQYDDNTHTQVFTTIEPGKPFDLNIDIWGQGSAVIEYYEFDLPNPTKVRNVTW